MQRDEGAGERPDEPADESADSGPVDHGGEAGERADAEAVAWAAIVANFGERAVLAPEDDAPGAATARAAGGVDHAGGGGDRDGDGDVDGNLDGRGDRDGDEPDALDALLEEEHRFIPPDPPPVPLPAPDRLAAWIGVFGSPAVLLVCLVVGVSIPTLLGWALVIGFIGGFCYLLARTPGTPREPWDDGSRV